MNTEIGDIIVASVNAARVSELVAKESPELARLIGKS